MALLFDPIPQLAVCFLIAAALVLLLEPLALPLSTLKALRQSRLERDWPAVLACRVGLMALVFALYFSISWRPLYALMATLTFYAVFAAISRAKIRFVREPLVFADVALLPLLLRHKSLFYANFLGLVFWLACVVYVVGATTLFYVFEPTILPESGRLRYILLGFAAAFVPWAILFSRPVRGVAGHAASHLLGTAEPYVSTLRFGVFAYVTLHFLAWLAFSREELSNDRTAAVASVETKHGKYGAPVILIWQSESFYDMRRAGAKDLALPTLDALRARAAQWGLLDSVFEGGYTMRTEFSVIAGISPAVLGPDAYYPYLRAHAYSAGAWPVAFRAHGWETTFIHPYDHQFFNRHKALPELGFERLLMLDAFAPASLVGSYISDRQLAERVVEICKSRPDVPQFMLVASMENHGPWEPGRVPDVVEPTEIYLKILQHTDAALERLFAELDAMNRPVWVAFYGDHAPLFASRPQGFPDSRTDYLVVPSGVLREAVQPRNADIDPWDLIGSVVDNAVKTHSRFTLAEKAPGREAEGAR